MRQHPGFTAPMLPLFIMKRILLLLSCCALLSISAQEKKSIAEAEPTRHHLVSISGALTSVDTWELDFSYHYMFLPYIGIGGSFGFWEQYYTDGYPSGPNWNIQDDDEKMNNLYLRPSLFLQSPKLFGIRDAVFKLFAQPGISLNVPYKSAWVEIVRDYQVIDTKRISTIRGQWAAYDFRGGISMNVGEFGILAGYCTSNLDISGMARHLSYNGTPFRQFYPKRRQIHGAFLAMTYRF